MTAFTTDRDHQSELVWYRRRSVLVVGAAVVIAAATVLSDLPQHSSRSQQIAADSSVITTINTNLRSCDYAVKQGFGIYRDDLAHVIPTSQQAAVPGLLSDDAQACSYTNPDIYNLSDISIPGSPSGKELQQLDSVVTTWTSSDALLAIEAIQKLWVSPHDAAAAKGLATAEKELHHDRATALRYVAAAEHQLDATLPPVSLPALPSS